MESSNRPREEFGAIWTVSETLPGINIEIFSLLRIDCYGEQKVLGPYGNWLIRLGIPDSAGRVEGPEITYSSGRFDLHQTFRTRAPIASGQADQKCLDVAEDSIDWQKYAVGNGALWYFPFTGPLSGGFFITFDEPGTTIGNEYHLYWFQLLHGDFQRVAGVTTYMNSKSPECRVRANYFQIRAEH